MKLRSLFLASAFVPLALLQAGGTARAFAFNGGPIVDSAPLHFGLPGPKRLAVLDDLHAKASDFRFVDNPYSSDGPASPVMAGTARMMHCHAPFPLFPKTSPCP